ncbi:hypothetical protein K788_0005727 [Paraburkholderia caribensis MBA4]|uniref:Uncharacterized protein n=1 Tax=Paraburkholderia caribensis MBA4 TaxID=1323664 RepID=A0A0P0RDM5_9BURK|nr:hypothetical protein K788_0005727 [Paraburkholderia caribensis MBA4]
MILHSESRFRWCSRAMRSVHRAKRAERREPAHPFHPPSRSPISSYD